MSRSTDKITDQLQTDLNYLGSQHPALSELAKSLAQVALKRRYFAVVPNVTETNNQTLSKQDHRFFPQQQQQQQQLPTQQCVSELIYENLFRHLLQSQLHESQPARTMSDTSSTNSSSNVSQTSSSFQYIQPIVVSADRSKLMEKEMCEMNTKTKLHPSGYGSHSNHNLVSQDNLLDIGSNIKSQTVDTWFNSLERIPITAAENKQDVQSLNASKLSNSFSTPTNQNDGAFSFSSVAVTSSTSSMSSAVYASSNNDGNTNAPTTATINSILREYMDKNPSTIHFLTKLLTSPVPLTNEKSNNAWDSIIQQLVTVLKQNTNSVNAQSVDIDSKHSGTHKKSTTMLPTTACSYPVDSTTSISDSNTSLKNIDGMRNTDSGSKVLQATNNSIHDTNITHQLKYYNDDNLIYSNIKVGDRSSEKKSQTELNEIPKDRRQFSRLWHRGYSGDRFVVRVVSINYRCRFHSIDQSVYDSRFEPCPNMDCTQNAQKIQVTFQAQLPSLVLYDELKRNVKLSNHTALTGIRLVFTCPLGNPDALVSIFNDPKLVDKLDVWENTGNRPGVRGDVIVNLRYTVCRILEQIQTKGFQAIKLSTDYIFFPPPINLQPIPNRHRPLSSSSDSSLPRIMESNNLSNVANRNCKYSDHTSHPSGCGKHCSVTQPQPQCSEIKYFHPISTHKERPRTWHQSPSHISPLCPHYNIENDESIERKSNNSFKNEIPDIQNLKSVSDKLANHNLTNSYDLAQLVNISMIDDSKNWLHGNESHHYHRMPNYKYATLPDASHSTPVSPTHFMKRCNYINSPESRWSNNLNQFRMAAVQGIHNSNSPLKVPKSSHSAYNFHYIGTPATNDQALSHQSDNLQGVLRVIACCLRNRPECPIIIMPNNRKPDDYKTEKVSPLIFQVPHQSSAFVGIPATPTAKPRIMTNAGQSALVILPGADSQNSVKITENGEWLRKQPTILAGPRPGNLLIITPDNNYEYIAQTKFDDVHLIPYN